MSPYTFAPIGIIHSCFSQKFGIPRQPRLVPQAKATLEMVAPFHQREALRGLEQFSHLWIVFVFHQCLGHSWRPTVRPPRLGGNRRLGVFATRSGFRPNPIGQSAVTLEKIEQKNGTVLLHLAGVDFVDGTPVLDIKPYLPYCDAIETARGGYAQETPAAKFKVSFSPQALAFCRGAGTTYDPQLEELVAAVLSQDPRPGYAKHAPDRCHGIRLWDLNLRFRVETDTVVVETIEQVPAESHTSPSTD